MQLVYCQTIYNFLTIAQMNATARHDINPISSMLD